MSSTDPSSPSYLLIFRDTSPDRYRALSSEERVSLLNQWQAWAHQLRDAGNLMQGSPLAPEGRVVKGTRGPQVFDGPFAESKEEVAGYFLITASDLDAATGLARQCPGLAHGMTVEIRPLADCCVVSRTQSDATAGLVDHHA